MRDRKSFFPESNELNLVAQRDTQSVDLLHRFFELQVEKYPDKVAVEWPDRGVKLSYRELDRRAEILSQLLVSKGIGPNEVCAIFLPRSSDQYLSMLAIMKAGGAYLPIDVEFPPDRVSYTIADAKVKAVITTTEYIQKIEGIPNDQIIAIDQFHWDKLEFIPRPLPHRPKPEDLCYIIYTSGTTGRPKGVAISHLNATTYVKALNQIYGISPSDRILQGFSTAFDASVEEIWMAFSTGATLVVGSAQTMRSIDELPQKLRDYNITVFSTVPTLLGVMEAENLPQLRLLIFGGEAARADIIEKWSAPHRKLMNTYGPTETTVVATYDWSEPGKPVTIGVPLPGYSALVLDEDLNEVPDGDEGELCIGGPAVSLRGYLNRPELNRKKFFYRDGIRYYRTGDLVRRNRDGKFLFLGRIDTQVKIRGYRVELEEIETQIIRWGGCEGAIVSVYTPDGGAPQLVAYLIISDPSREVDVADLQKYLKERLPAYMIPSLYLALHPNEVPRLTSGKVARRALPPPDKCKNLLSTPSKNRNKTLEKLSPKGEKLRAIWKEVLGEELDADDSFFDFGGNSVTAAEVVSLCRREPDLSQLTIRDLYQYPTLRELERVLLSKGKGHSREEEKERKRQIADKHFKNRVSSLQYAACVSAQTLTLLALFALSSLTLLGTLYLLYQVGSHLLDKSPLLLGMVGVALYFMLPPVATVLFVGFYLFLKKFVIGDLKPGDYPIWSWGYFRWWLSNLLLAPIRGLAGAFVGSPFVEFFYRLLGAEIGENVYLASPLPEPELVSIGDGASIGEGVIFRTHALQDGILKLRKVRVGRNAFVGPQAVLGPNSYLADNCKLYNLSYLPEDMETEPGTEWFGSPARELKERGKLSQLTAQLERDSRAGYFWETWQDKLFITLMQGAFSYVFGLLASLPFFITVGILIYLEHRTGVVLLLDLSILIPLSFLFAAIGFFGLLGVIIASKWLLVGRIRPGVVPLNSIDYVKRWFSRSLMQLLVSPMGVRGVTETLLMPKVARLLGMKVGKMAEISDAVGFHPDLISLGDYSMLADQCFLGSAVVHRGLYALQPIEIGDKTFIGNWAHVPITTNKIGKECLLGVLSIAPDEVPDGSDWLGSPPMRLHNRIKKEGPIELTFNPPRHLVWARAFLNLWKMLGPGLSAGIIFWIYLKVSVLAYLHLPFYLFIPAFIGISIAATAAGLLLVIALKWLLIGRYRPGEKPLWSFWLWRMEIAYEIELFFVSLVGPLLEGTPLYNWFYRLQGMKIGSRVCMFHATPMEPDLIQVGDHTSIEGILQTHLFEDRIMKLGPIRVGSFCSTGRNSGVLYNSEVGDHAVLEDLSLVMKSERLPAFGRYRGIPAE